MRGKLIALEGIDTEILFELAEKLSAQFKNNNITNVIVTQEPTDGPLGVQLKLVENNRILMDEYARVLLRVADRIDHFESGSISTDLQNGKFVLYINYLLSSFASRSNTISLDWLMKVNQLSPVPDISIFVDIPVENVLIRLIKENGYDDSEVTNKRNELTDLRANYLDIISIMQKQSHKIDMVGGSNIDAVSRGCAAILEKILI